MKGLFDPVTLMVVSLAGIGVLSIISIASNNVWGFVIGIALALGLLFGGILRLRAGDKETTKITCLPRLHHDVRRNGDCRRPRPRGHPRLGSGRLRLVSAADRPLTRRGRRVY